MCHSIAQIVVGLPVAGPFDYSIPHHLREHIRVGSRVVVSFRSKFRVGFVIGLLTETQFPRIKPLSTVLDNIPTLDEHFLKLTWDLAQYYACSWGEAIEVALPAILRDKREIVWTPQPQIMRPTEPKILFYQGSLQAAAKTVAQKLKSILAQGGGIIFLVPEIGQIMVVKEFLEKVCAVDVCVLDRYQGVKHELTQWLAVKEGRARVVLGTRSAVFAMMPDVGLIVMVDEENPSYKQEPSPFYHARQVALWRHKNEQCDVLFVSPAPSAELWKILKDKKVVPEICAEKHLADFQVIDLANYKYQNMLVSFPLQNMILETLVKNGKVLLFLNRRGFSTSTKCNQCGLVLKCQRCNTNLSFMYSKKKLMCHRCGFSSDLPKMCPQCNGSYLRSTGTGIEKLESELARIYPQAQVATFDRGAKTFSKQSNLMIATAAVMPFLHRAHFSLIAVLDFDGEINRIDFRASSRVFSLLIRLRQAAGEKLLVQTRSPKHESIVAAASLDADTFYRKELKVRRELNLPPYAQVMALALRGTVEESVLTQAQELYEQLKGIKGKGFEIALPQPDVIPKLRDKFRYTIMLKGKIVKKMLAQVEPVLSDYHKRKGVILTVDVNP
ncbi:MAG: primosomal protein N' [Candidatus Omnitrophica bacterium]|nr:primosomal protein N' [Candidatus Omnitrophota bacterium]